MIKIVLDFIWILSSMSLYLLFYKLANIGTTPTINMFGNIKICNFVLQTDYFIIILLALTSIIIVNLYRFAIKPSDTLKIHSVKIAEPMFIPTYVAYFVIAMGISNIVTFWWVLLILILLISLTKIFYFNPILLFFGYHFYEAKDINDTTFLLISKKKDLKGKQDFSNLYRLNNFNFLDLSNN